MVFRLLSLIFLLSGCSSFREEAAPIKKADLTLPFPEEEEAPFIPLKLNTSEKTPEIPAAFRQRVSLTLTGKSSLKEAIATLAAEVGVNYHIVGLEGEKDHGLFFSAVRKPFIEIIEALCARASLRYTLQKGTLIIEPDTPYIKTYTVVFPTQVRESAHTVSTAINVFSADKNATKTLDNSSSSTLKAEGRSDFWEEVEQSLEAMLETPEAESGEILSLHRQAGLITILANRCQHQKIEEYLETLRLTSMAQVLIEAKILEVSLNDAYRSGINWQSFYPSFITGIPAGTATEGGSALANVRTGSSDLFTFGFQNRNLSAIAHFIERFGSVRTLSNPRLTVMNNQVAILKVARNEIFFRIEYSRNFSNNNSGRDYENAVSHAQTVPIGLILTVQPAINLETGDVILTLRPTISRISGTKEDPAVAYLAQGRNTTNTQGAIPTIKSVIPVVEVREMDSVLTLHSGEVALLGGLMQERDRGMQTGLPGTQGTPILQDVLGAQGRDSEVIELIILLRARIVTPRKLPLSRVDQHLLTKFGGQHRHFPAKR